jgi:hypothetical protein
MTSVVPLSCGVQANWASLWEEKNKSAASDEMEKMIERVARDLFRTADLFTGGGSFEQCMETDYVSVTCCPITRSHALYVA